MAGYSSTPLQKKLGIKEGMRLHIHDAPTNYFDLISPLPEQVEITMKLSGELDFVHLFVKDLNEFKRRFNQCKKHVSKDGMMWVSWPKKASKVHTDLDENIIREVGLSEGMVDVKVCAIDDVWSGLKFVYRLKDR
jgi:hypothetical protein